MSIEENAMRLTGIRDLTLAVSVCMMFIAAPSAQAASTSSSEGQAFESRIANVERLIEQSSGAERVKASGNPKALEPQARARELRSQALQRYQAGDVEDANRLLGEATKEMMAAIRLAGRPASMDEKKREDFEARAESIAALLDALDRIAAEKDVPDVAARVEADVGVLVGKARELEAAGKLDDARRTLNAAYDMTKGAIEELRGGDTLVRNLEFASKEEEYRYELDRNDTHQMLIKVLVEEKGGGQRVDEMVGRFVEKAGALRARAEREAGGGDYAGAVATLEQSTKELVRAIRSAGIYIPG